MPLRHAVAGLLALSDERELHARLCLAAWRDGYAAAAAQFGDYEARGYAAAIADVKRAQHEIVAAVRLGLARTAPAGAAWLWAALRNGATEYGGRGRRRVPVPTVDIARVSREQR